MSTSDQDIITLLYNLIGLTNFLISICIISFFVFFFGIIVIVQRIHSLDIIINTLVERLNPVETHSGTNLRVVSIENVTNEPPYSSLLREGDTI